ncbi:hypothetical protein OQ496_03270 [Acetobacter suratthaniensis]|uniref:Uncharacterized protein n=1 Tax=Acetobacter suratthaniensis TaxID=1502841 RepID=A0ABS3LH45_9PROT|nr:hypothetical protein [Acetobacter suratthaniensis]MBO1326914.1 hypothetical protein [Acetobacter suratthaniensis]MCX2565476.1 hypothetical protein [Acetobacter suratthaniensis]
MKQSQADRLTGFLEERLPPEAYTDFYDMLEDLLEASDGAGADDTEVAMRTVDLLNFLDERLPEDEVSRVRKIIFGTDDQGKIVAQDAALRVKCAMRAEQYAKARVMRATGADAMACDSAADAYRLGLTALGQDATHVTDDAARSIFEGFVGQRKQRVVALSDLEVRLGTKAPRNFG